MDLYVSKDNINKIGQIDKCLFNVGRYQRWHPIHILTNHLTGAQSPDRKRWAHIHQMLRSTIHFLWEDFLGVAKKQLRIFKVHSQEVGWVSWLPLKEALIKHSLLSSLRDGTDLDSLKWFTISIHSHRYAVARKPYAKSVNALPMVWHVFLFVVADKNVKIIRKSRDS